MPSKRNAYRLTACSDYSLRVCGDDPCEYHIAVDDAKARGITIQALIEFRNAEDDEYEKE